MTKPVSVYGIKACDTMKKARTWLETHGVAYDFHDYKTEGASRDLLENWTRAVGWEVLLNRAGTTFRKLPDADKTGIDAAKAIAIMLAQPSMIKRPVLDQGGKLIVGFKPEVYAQAFK
jgi:arsenate reductase